MKKYLSIALLTGALLMSGCGDSENFVFTNNTNVQVAPVCVDDAYTTNQDTTLTVNATNGVLANDTLNGASIESFDGTSDEGGSVSVNADGSFTYTPPSGFAGPDFFTYTVANSAGQRTCTVTITVVAVNGFFVDAVNGNDGTGSFNGGLPFQTIQAAVAAAPTNADIVVLPGNYTGGINLKDGQRLLGSGSVLAQGASRPQLTGPVVMADGNTLDFLRIEGTNGDAVDGIGQDGGVITNCEFNNIIGAGSAAVELDGAFGNWTVSNNVISNTDGTSIFARITGTSQMRLIIRQNEITNADLGAIGLVSEDTSDVAASVVGNVMRGNNIVTGDAFELICGDMSQFCLDLEDNVADLDTNANNGANGVYSLLESPLGGGGNVLEVEQLSVLTDPQPGGAGNTGVVDDGTGIGGTPPGDVVDGTCGF